MTCQIGSEEPAEQKEHHRRQKTAESSSTFLRGYDFPPSADNTYNLAAIMYLKVLFFAAVALTGALTDENSGEFATSHCGASG